MSARTSAMMVLATLLGIAPAFAQPPIKAKIPFDFKVNGKSMSAGEYSVKLENPGVLWLVRDDRKDSCAALTNGVQARAGAPETGKLVFNRYGDSYFLSEVWHPGYDRGRQLPKSKAELEIARTATVRHASVPAAPAARASGRSGTR